MENLATADAVLVFVRRLGLPSDQLKLLREFVASGKPVIGLRTASHAFKLKNKPDGSYEVPEGIAEWGTFDPDILGGSYTGHEANEIGAHIKNLAGEHPILKGVEPAAWHSLGSLYNTGAIAADALRLQEGGIPGVTEALTWIREAGQGRGKVFYTSLGHPADFSEPAFRQLLLNAIKWSVGTL
jgi:type 1 glutamine amidotransferase